MTLLREFPTAVAFKDLRLNHGSFPVRNGHYYNIWFIDPRTPKSWCILRVVSECIKQTFFDLQQNDAVRNLVIEDCGKKARTYSLEERSIHYKPNKPAFPREELSRRAGFGGQEGQGASPRPDCSETQEKVPALENKKAHGVRLHAKTKSAAVAASTHY